MRKEYERVAKTEAVLGFVRKRFEVMLDEELEKGRCEERQAYEYIINSIDYAKICVKSRRLGYAMFASAMIAWVMNMLALAATIIRNF